MAKYFIVAILSGIVSCFGQVLLKKSATIPREGIVKQYLNVYVVSGYGLYALCMLATVYSYVGMPFKYGSVLESLGYFYIMILSKLFFDEKITPRKLIGNLLIVAGVIIFSL